MKRILTLLIAAGFALPPLPGEARAGCRHVKIVQQQAVVAYQPVAAPYYWAVGQQLQDDAHAQRIASKVLQLLAQQAQAPQQAAPCPTCPTPPQTEQLTAAPDRWALVKAACASCHTTNSDAMAAVDMTDLSLLSCETKLKMAAAILDSKMPPKKALEPSLLGNLLGEIVGAETVAK